MQQRKNKEAKRETEPHSISYLQSHGDLQAPDVEAVPVWEASRPMLTARHLLAVHAAQARVAMPPSQALVADDTSVIHDG